VFRINAGGQAYVDASGNNWSADQKYNSGTTYFNAHAIGFTNDPALYQSSRVSNPGEPELTYSLPVANGNYQVRLYFAELVPATMKVGGRTFTVSIQGTAVLNALDVYASVGANRALIKTSNVAVTTGTLTISFHRLVGNPMVSAIEVLSLADPAKQLTGIYYGNQGFKMQQVQDFEAWTGKKNAVLNMFQSWCATQNTDLFTTQLPNVWANGNVPMITWEPFYCNDADTPADVATRTAAGQYDSYLNDFADQLKVWLAGNDGVYATGDDRRIYIRLAHEMNGNWYPWSGNPADFISMWRHVKSIFESKGLDISHVQFMWIVNVGDKGNFTAEQYFPGAGYVDWVGMDGYNAYTTADWLEPPNRYDTMIARLRALTTKPISIAEVGVMTNTAAGMNLTAKSDWMKSFFAYLQTKSEIKMFVYFNKDLATTQDYCVMGGANGPDTFSISGRSYKAYSAYKAGVASSSVIPGDVTNARLLTDAQFSGQF
jgi:mannan endo-1,4-beta-mannosidase